MNGNQHTTHIGVGMTKNDIDMANFRINHGVEYPYHSPEKGRKPKINEDDFASKAAAGILDDLLDRRGIKYELGGCEHDIKKEIFNSLRNIIEVAYTAST